MTRTPEQESLIEALHRVEMGSAAWQPFARLAVQETACRFASFTSDHVWQTLIRHRIPFPREGRAMAPAMRHGVTMRWMDATDRFETVASPATGRHPGPQRVYVSRISGRPNPEWPEPPAGAAVAVFNAAVPMEARRPKSAQRGPGEPTADPGLALPIEAEAPVVPRDVPCPTPGCNKTVFLIGQTIDPRWWNAQCLKHGKVMVRT